MSDKGIIDQAKEAVSGAYDSISEGAKHLKEKIVGEPSTEDKVADKVKSVAEETADKIGELRDKAGEKLIEAGEKLKG